MKTKLNNLSVTPTAAEQFELFPNKAGAHYALMIHCNIPHYYLYDYSGKKIGGGLCGYISDSVINKRKYVKNYSELSVRKNILFN